MGNDTAAEDELLGELAYWTEQRGAHLVTPEDSGVLWPRLLERHPTMVAALLKIQGQQEEVLICRTDVTASSLIWWLREIRARAEGQRPMNWLSGEKVLPDVWYVFGGGRELA